MKFISQLMCLIIFSTFSAQSYSAETFALMSEYGTQEAYEVEQALVAQAEVLTQENINKGVLEYKKGIKKILKRSDKRIGKLFLKKENIESLKNANLNINDKKILGKQIRVLLEKELKRDIASDTNLTSSFVKDFEHTLIKKSRSGFGRFMCHVGRVALGVVGVALIAAAFVALMAAGFAQSLGLIFAGLGLAAGGVAGGAWAIFQGFNNIRCE